MGLQPNSGPCHLFTLLRDNCANNLLQPSLSLDTSKAVFQGICTATPAIAIRDYKALKRSDTFFMNQSRLAPRRGTHVLK